MAEMRIFRVDLPLRLQLADDGGVLAAVAGNTPVKLPVQAITEWSPGENSVFKSAVLENITLRPSLENLMRELYQTRQSMTKLSLEKEHFSFRVLPRLAITSTNRELDEFPWESVLAEAIGDSISVIASGTHRYTYAKQI